MSVTLPKPDKSYKQLNEAQTRALIEKYLNENSNRIDAVSAASAAHQNVLPNTQWQLRTALSQITAFKPDNTGTQFSGYSVTSYTTGSNTVVCTVASTTGLRVGLIGVFTGGAHADMKICAAEITALTATTFTVKLPRGLVGAASAACTFTPIMRGDDVGTSTDGPDGDWLAGWYKTNNLKMWIEDDPAITVNFPGADRVVRLMKTDSSQAIFYYSANPDGTTLRKISPFYGRNFCMGFELRQDVKGGSGTALAFITNGSGSTSVYGTAMTRTQQWLETTTTLTTTDTTLNCGAILQGASGDIYTFALPAAGRCTTFGSAAGYTRPVREVLLPRVKYTPDSYNTVSITSPATETSAGLLYGFAFRLYPETNGALTKDVTAAHVGWGGTQATAGPAWGLRNQDATPHIYGPWFVTQVDGRKMIVKGLWSFAGGEGFVYCDTASQTLTATEIDFAEIIL